jgi:DNA mismatch repair protein PMS2
MFFVNTRPCVLPQVAKVFNEVYKSYNISQSPFIIADILLDTSMWYRNILNFLLIVLDAYDVNVSPDKRTILLHEQNTLLDVLRVSSQT